MGTVDPVFLIFGFRTSNRRLATPILVCAYCGAGAAQALIKRTTKFSLFFVPLFPVRRPSYYLECTNCGRAGAVDPRDVARLTA